MHAIKAGWVGQPFALAKCNDSGGKKSRIRRSKEERKAMVESFIKKYQKLNNGNFPSLNLTHKEVGGSFYTVREIVREIIQENRVLGPSKLTPEEQSADRFLEQFPLGSISIEPETDLLSSNESHMVTHYLPNHHVTSEELVLNSSVHCLELEHQRFNDGHTINGSIKEVEKNEDYDKAIYTESLTIESLELEENVAELEASKAKVTRVVADVKVETFPLISGSRITYGLDEISSEPSDSTGTFIEKEIEKVEMEAGNNNSVVDEMNFLESSSGLGNEKAGANLAGPLLEKSSAWVDEKPAENLEDPLLENSSGSTTKEGIVLEINNGTDPEVKDALAGGIKPVDALDGVHAQNLNGTNTSSCERSISMEAITTKNLNIQLGGNSMKGSNPTLDRMNLESWEETSGKPAKPETNPLLVLFKSFIAAFVKFWSE